ncbi:MAG: caspase family protein [Bacteroidota bacterium]
MSNRTIIPKAPGSGKQYLVLLVAINDYPSPVSALGGCISDVNKIESYLKANFGNSSDAVTTPISEAISVRSYGALHICRLENEKATHSNITTGFRDFLRDSGPEDVVWFHFSGHGSEQFTAKEFLDIEPNGKDQTLVCYSRGEQDDFLHMADKELAVLLHQVDSQHLDGSPKSSPHIIVSLDCCHSGSGTRDFEMDPTLKSRNADLITGLTRKAEEEKQGIRDLNTYADGYYAKQWNENKQLQVPLSNHVLLSACESVQLAADRPDGGIFTEGLISALKGASGEINYYDLYVRTKAAVQSARGSQQSPQFETIGGFNAYTRFMDGSNLGKPNNYQVFKGGTRWLVKCGAIHGIPPMPEKPVEVEIMTAAPENKTLGTAELTAIGAQQSTLKSFENLGLDSGNTYQAVLKSLPATPILVWVHGNTSGITALEDAWEDSKQVKIVKSLDEFGDAQLEVEITDSAYKVKDRRDGRQVIEWPVNLDNANHTVVDILGKMANWERILGLQNEKSVIKDWIGFEIDVAKNPVKPFTTLKDPDNHLTANATDYIIKDGAVGAILVPKLKLTGKPDQNLYVYLLHFRSNYAISCYEGEVIYRSAEFKNQSAVEIKLWKQFRGWGLSPDDQSSFCHFKLLVTTEPFAYQQLLQADIEGDRGFDLDEEPYNIENEWYCKNIKVTLER